MRHIITELFVIVTVKLHSILLYSPSMFCEQVFMAVLCNRAGHYIFALWFVLLSIYLLFFSPNLSRRRLDVYHTSTHGVALVQISDAGLKRAARGLLKVQVAKNRQKFAI